MSLINLIGFCCLPWIMPGLAYLAGFHGFGWIIVFGAPPFTALVLALARPQWRLIDGMVQLPRFPFFTRRIPVSRIARLHSHLIKPGTGKEWAVYDLVLIDGAREVVGKAYVGSAGVSVNRKKMASANQRSSALLLAEALAIPVVEDEDVLSYRPRA